jgi:hypothetical protein
VIRQLAAPRIELTLRLEGERVQIVFNASSHEDEIRLSHWLGHARIGERIERALADALAQLERRRAA